MNPAAMSTAVTHNLWSVGQDLAFTLDGGSLVTTQESGIARLFSTSDPTVKKSDSIPIKHTALKQASLVACHMASAAIADGPTVMLFKITSGCPSFSHLVTRHSLPVSALAFSTDGVWIASGSQDCTVRLVRENQIGDMYHMLHHKFPVCCLSFDPLGMFLASISTDGALAVWDLANDRIVVASLDTGKPTLGAPKPVVAWSPKGNVLAVTSASNDVLLIDRNRLSLVGNRLVNAEQTKPISTITWSPNAEFLAAGVLGSQIVVWNVNTPDVPPIKHLLSTDPVKMAWQPRNNTIAILLHSQVLIFFDSVVLGDFGACPAGVPALKSVRAGPFDTEAKQTPPTMIADKSIKHPTREKPKWMDDETAVCSNDSGSEPPNDDDLDNLDNASDLDDFLVDDNVSGKTRKQKRFELKEQFRNAGFAETTPLQPAFQPGTTPVIQGKRYLAFNFMGLITSVEQQVRHSYQVEFHDQSRLRRPLQFSDPREFTMASLSPTVAVFLAPPSQEEPETPTIVHARILDGPSAGNVAKSVWTLALDSEQCGEYPVGVAAGSNRIIVATDRTMRVISIGGIVMHSFDVPSQVVALAASGKWCIWVTHRAAPFNGDQQLTWALFDMMALIVVQTGEVVLSARSQLEWLSFSSELIPVSMDSKGILRGLGSGWLWSTILNTRRQVPTDGTALSNYSTPGFHHWPVGVLGTTLLSVLCRVPAGAMRVYPPIPRPALTETECVIPGIPETVWPTQRFFHATARRSMDDDVGLAETVQDTRGRDLDKHALMQIQAMCKADRLQCALDWAYSLILEDSLDKAIKIALHYNKPALGDRIHRILLQYHHSSSHDAVEPPPAMQSSKDPMSQSRAAYSYPAKHAPENTPPSPFTGMRDFSAYETAEFDPPADPPAKRPRTLNPFGRRSGTDPFLSVPNTSSAGSRNSSASLMSANAASGPVRQSTLSQFMHRKQIEDSRCAEPGIRDDPLATENIAPVDSLDNLVYDEMMPSDGY